MTEINLMKFRGIPTKDIGIKTQATWVRNDKTGRYEREEL